METKQTIQTQLLEFQKKVTVIKKDAKNPHFKNTYASLTQIISAVSYTHLTLPTICSV